MTSIMFSAGELSGDEHGARLLENLKPLYPQGEFFGMGGHNLKAAGLELSVDIERTGTVMGFTEILGGLGTVFRTWKTMTRLITERKPQVLVIINYSEFNLRLARVAKTHRVKVLFYIPPQVWAWRPGRVREIDRVCDVVATIFPFEKDFYARRGCHKVISVGHPFVAHFEKHRITESERREIRTTLGVDDVTPLVLLFPGSRKKEILGHLNFVFEVFRRVHRQYPTAKGVIVSASAKWVDQFSAEVPKELPIQIVTGDSLKLLQVGDAGLIKSGTSNLQAAFAALPFVMFYRVSKVSAWIIRRLVKGISQYSIVNILRPHTVPEVVEERELNPDKAAEELLRIIAAGDARNKMLQGFSEIIASLSQADNLPCFAGCSGASERTARIIQELINGRKLFS